MGADDMIKKFTDKTFQDEISQGVTLVDFYADWCGPCKMLSPILNKIAEEMKEITIAKVDIDKEELVTSKFQITSVPTLILFKDGNEVGRLNGLYPEAQIKTLIKSAM